MINLFKKWTIVKPSCFDPKTVVTLFAHGFKTKKKNVKQL